jgi:hypothetical protein
MPNAPLSVDDPEGSGSAGAAPVPLCNSDQATTAQALACSQKVDEHTRRHRAEALAEMLRAGGIDNLLFG